MILVTGGAGFIGSNLVRALNDRGSTDVVVVDDLSHGRKLLNLADCEIADLFDRDVFLDRLSSDRALRGSLRAVLHQGACSDTMEWDGRFLMRVNYDYSKALLAFAAERRIPFLYASSASVYGTGQDFRVDPACERPANLYAYSKLLFDRYVRRQVDRIQSQVVGLRYFNVYGPREDHKGEMASVALKLYRQLRESGKVRLFEGTDGYADGEQRRDFVWIGDAVSVNLFFLDHPERSGLFNVGTGRAQSFNDVARAVLRHQGRGEIEYVPFPEALRGRYQSYTCADIGSLRACGYTERFLPVEEGVPRYLDWLEKRGTVFSS